MRITHEADYAVRIAYTLLREKRMLSARELSEMTGVTQRFTLKILRKMSEDKIVAAQKGANGGYKLICDPQELSLGMLIECIDGPFELSHCMSEDFDCTRVTDKTMCRFHHIFNDISLKLRDEFYSIKLISLI